MGVCTGDNLERVNAFMCIYITGTTLAAGGFRMILGR